jgi:hypothetical protein
MMSVSAFCIGPRTAADVDPGRARLAVLLVSALAPDVA